MTYNAAMKTKGSAGPSNGCGAVSKNPLFEEFQD